MLDKQTLCNHPPLWVFWQVIKASACTHFRMIKQLDTTGFRVPKTTFLSLQWQTLDKCLHKRPLWKQLKHGGTLLCGIKPELELPNIWASSLRVLLSLSNCNHTAGADHTCYIAHCAFKPYWLPFNYVYWMEILKKELQSLECWRQYPTAYFCGVDGRSEKQMFVYANVRPRVSNTSIVSQWHWTWWEVKDATYKGSLNTGLLSHQRDPLS